MRSGWMTSSRHSALTVKYNMQVRGASLLARPARTPFNAVNYCECASSTNAFKKPMAVLQSDYDPSFSKRINDGLGSLRRMTIF